MKKGLVVAITGRSGCGKSTLSSYYRSKGFTVIDCDEVAKYVRTIPDCVIELADYFGYDILLEGVIDTKILAARAFSSPEKLQKLTDITHVYIEAEILKRTDLAFAGGRQVVFVDGAVIIGHTVEKHCDKFIVVVIDEEKQTAHLMQRDNISKEAVQQRLKGQTSYSDMLKKADFVINNNSGVDTLILQGEFVLKQLTKI